MALSVAMGLDVSTRTGCVVLREQFHSPQLLHESEMKAEKGELGLDRASAIAGQMIRVLDAFHPDIVVFEGYGFANGNSLATLVEIGTVLRYFVRQYGRPFILLPPNSLKKFATGKGNTPKEMIPLAVYQRWHHQPLTHNTADAYVLAAAGLGYRHALDGMIAPQKEVLKKVPGYAG